jgi:secretion/DNA translocation related TadE-like protein
MSERGAVSVLAAVIVLVAGLAAAGVARVGAAAVLQARADAAADAAALAAADALALGRDGGAARAAASAVASDNGARLLTCDCRGRHAEVAVRIDARGALGSATGGVVGRARAEVTVDPALSGARP